jgi:hypothetical protein
MSLLVGLLLLGAFAIPLVISMRRANELFVMEVRDGNVRVIRGRAPQRLLDDLETIVARGGVETATIRVVTEDGVARAVTGGALTDAQCQQVRNVVGMWPIAKIRAGRRPGRP